MACEECEGLRDRVEALEKDNNFAAGRCEMGLHAVAPIVRERTSPIDELAQFGTGEPGVIREFFLACAYCDRLFYLATDMLGGLLVNEMDVDQDELRRVREEAPIQPIMRNGSPTSNLPGEVIEAEVLPPEGEGEDGGSEEDVESEDGGGGSLYRKW